ncbi:hypothetical protein AAFF_G00407460, partial [Aldrovandia affinis]
ITALFLHAVKHTVSGRVQDVICVYKCRSTSTAVLNSTPAQRTLLSWSTCHQANLMSYKSTDFGCQAVDAGPELQSGDSGVDSGGLEDPSCKPETLLVDHGGEIRIKPGLRKYACQLTLDPNTVSRWLSLSEGDRKVTCGREEQPYPHHPERFKDWTQVLCREGLSGRCYWEAEWSVGEGGWVVIGVAYKGICSGGGGFQRDLGGDEKSWSLVCCDDIYNAMHKGNRTHIRALPTPSCRVGVFLDWPAGTLSFYHVSSDTLTRLHTFQTTFTEPLYPGFKVGRVGTSVSLCMLG